MTDREISLLAVGDVQPDREEPRTLFEGVQSLFEEADFRFGQLECTISDKGVLRTDVRNPAHRVHPRNIEALIAAPFDMVSYAGNNNLDYGIEAFEDTLQRLTENGIQYVGAGENLKEATSHRTVTLNGIRVAFVNFCSILRDGYAATDERPGIAPLPVATFYEPLENIYEQPGTPSRTVTVVKEADLALVRESIAAASADSDVCIALFHWGVHFTHDLSPYQPVVAYEAIDAGADLVIGTHPHCLQAVDVYKGKAIFYSLGNFAFEQNRAAANRGVSEYLDFYGLEMDELKQHPHPSHCRRTIGVKITIRDGGIKRLNVCPVFFNDEARPERVREGHPVFGEIRELIDRLSAEVGTSLQWTDEDAQVDLDSPSVDTRRLLEDRAVSYPWLTQLRAKNP